MASVRFALRGRGGGDLVGWHDFLVGPCHRPVPRVERRGGEHSSLSRPAQSCSSACRLLMHRLEGRPSCSLNGSLRGLLRLEAAAADRVVVAVGDLYGPGRAGLLDEYDAAGDAVIVCISVDAHFSFPFLAGFSF